MRNPHLIAFSEASAAPALALVSPPPKQDFSELDLERAQRIAGRAAQKLSGSLFEGLGSRDDLQQELITQALDRWSQFDPQRSTQGTFLEVVIGRQAASLVRREQALKRGNGHQRSNGYVDTETLSSGRNGRCVHAKVDVGLRHDVRGVLAQLPPVLRRFCGLLTRMSVSSAARVIGIRRHEATRWLSILRLVFEAAGIVP